MSELSFKNKVEAHCKNKEVLLSKKKKKLMSVLSHTLYYHYYQFAYKTLHLGRAHLAAVDSMKLIMDETLCVQLHAWPEQTYSLLKGKQVGRV